ncbi:MAG: HDOD domain-containing protein [Gammaproteobacteria bacterium]
MQAAQLVADNVELVSLPEVCLRMQALADDPHVTADQLGQVLSQDPALTARLLKLVNSPYYGLAARVDTASRAVSVAGMEALRNLALAASAVEVFNRVPAELMDMVTFWKHSVFSGLLARKLAERCRVLHSERLFITGLLHDVGRLLIYARMPEAAAEVLRRADSGGVPVCELEQQVLGFDHAEVGQALLAQWQLPANLQEAVAFHHAPSAATVAPLEAALVHIANAVTHQIDASGEVDDAYYNPYGALLEVDGAAALESITGVDAAAWKTTRLSPAAVRAAVTGAAESFDQVLDVIYPLPY